MFDNTEWNNATHCLLHQIQTNDSYVNSNIIQNVHYYAKQYDRSTVGKKIIFLIQLIKSTKKTPRCFPQIKNGLSSSGSFIGPLVAIYLMLFIPTSEKNVRHRTLKVHK